MQVLGEAESGTDESFESYDADSFDSYIKRLEQLDSTFVANKDYLIGQSSLEEYEWNKQVLTVVRQASDVRRTIQQNNFVNDPRDPRMADNAIWYSNYFNGDKIAVWAHNGHIDNNEPSETMGYYLKQQLGNDYGTVGFSFSKGSFTAIGQGGLRPRTIVVDPEENSLNQYFSQSEHPQFSINLNALEAYQVWRDKFSEGIEYIYIGSVFNRTPDFYYSDFEPEYFDEMIYIDNTTAADNF